MFAWLISPYAFRLHKFFMVEIQDLTLGRVMGTGQVNRKTDWVAFCKVYVGASVAGSTFDWGVFVLLLRLIKGLIQTVNQCADAQLCGWMPQFMSDHISGEKSVAYFSYYDIALQWHIKNNHCPSQSSSYEHGFCHFFIKVYAITFTKYKLNCHFSCRCYWQDQWARQKTES